MNKKAWKKVMCGILAVAMSGVLAACAGTASTSTGTNGQEALTFMIWDSGQRAGMQSLADAYTAENPSAKIEIQVVNWDEYWTKLSAAASSGTLPEIFWMHTNEFEKYAAAGMLADVSGLYDQSYWQENFPENLVQNSTYQDTLYGVPKDYDTVALAYNKELFDAANLSYPDATWTWDDLTAAANAIYKATGVYGYAAPLEDQCGYLPFVYQAGGYLLNEDATQSGFTNQGTQSALETYFGFQNLDSVPTQAQIAEADGQTRFMSGQLGMFAWGSWILSNWYNDFPEMSGKWDFAVLPACPTPVSGDGRATIVNGLSYATAAKNQNNETVMGFLKFLASEQAATLQGESGCAIPAYNGSFDTWAANYPDINVDVFNEMMDYAVQFPNHATKSQWEATVKNAFLDVCNGSRTLTQVLPELQAEVDTYLQEG